MSMHLPEPRGDDDFDALNFARLQSLLAARISALSDDLKKRVAAAEPGSTRLSAVGDGWFAVTIGNADPIEIGHLHISSLRRDLTPHSLN